MAFDEGLAQRVREAFEEREDVTERRMFGGIAFLLAGNLCVGVVGDDLMVRVGADAHAEALAEPGSREMDFTGRPMKGLVYVDGARLDSDARLAAWLRRGVAFAGSLPPK